MSRLRLSISFILCTLALVGFAGVWAESPPAHPVDLLPECQEWAERGDCKHDGRPYFMKKNCPESCHKVTYREPEQRVISDDDNEELYELSAKDANGKVLSLENFEGYVTVIVNAARICHQSEFFYETLEHLHSINPWSVEILAFPFEHPDIDISSCKDEIEKLEKKERKIHVMELSEINGPNIHPVFKYLKKLFDMEEMGTDVSHYFFINPDGNYIELHYGANYRALKQFVDSYLHQLDDIDMRRMGREF